MKMSGWGHYPTCEASLQAPASISECQQLLNQNQAGSLLIPRGFGRSYGDSALASTLLSSRYLDHFLDFNPQTGLLSCQAGVSLGDILNVFVPKGFFLPVVPGTQHVSLGGAIASDIHGKNHHLAGSFCEHIASIKLLTPSGLITCTPNLNPELFLATCGGMGLTGFITEACIYLKPIQSAFIEQSVIASSSLEETMTLLGNEDYHYSVSWLDLSSMLSPSPKIITLLGNHATKGGLVTKKPNSHTLPPTRGWCLNRATLKTFNAIYHGINKHKKSPNILHYQDYFFPLDKLCNWYNLYGNSGLIQYQFVLPAAQALAGLTEVFNCLKRARCESYLAVLKNFRYANENYLSFPLKGYTLALDFKQSPKLLNALNECDDIIVARGGRLYLTKDARMSAASFEACYPNASKFKRIRQQYDADECFASLQSKRLKI